MHNHVDRDDYIEIIWENIWPFYYDAFAEVDPGLFNNFGTSYDMKSIMHYGRYTFTWNGEDTVVPHDSKYLDDIGARVISDGDVERLNKMYQCSHEAIAN